MAYINKIEVFKEIQRIADLYDYTINDKEALSMTASLINIIKDNNKKSREFTFEQEDSYLEPVDKAISDNEWQIYCSDPIWAGYDSYDSQRRKGLIKSIECYQY